ncbi:hypothetical protein [Flavobacterium sp. 14A]|uniref:hypothetical protein n=1 Tax=Flavobacterium sp. 14A TaxID=2735896 RepID=UPI00156E144F|nr:hypothetical protein [Flavobacterium sp. 14A]NRT12644.1 hypothetical protein [Flavobacterium sp. 14A]
MKELNPTASLDRQIIALKEQQREQKLALNQQVKIVYESVKPSNLINTAVNEIVKTPNLRNNMLNNLVGLSTGYLSKKLMVAGSTNPLKKILGTVAQFLITNVVSKHSDGIVEKLGHMMKDLPKR